jgi:predicted transcriptional regulator
MKMTLTIKAQNYVDAAVVTADQAADVAREAQVKLDQASPTGYGPSHAVWYFMALVEESLIRARAYQGAVEGAVAAHNYPEAKRRLSNLRTEAEGVQINAEKVVEAAQKS